MLSTRGVTAGILFLCLAALAFAGCGGGGDSDEPEALTKAQYVKQAEAICKKTDAKQSKLVSQELKARAGSGPASKSEQEAFVTKAAVPPLEEEAANLAELGGPEGEEEKAEAMVKALEKATQEIKEDPQAFIEGQSKAFVPVEKMASDLGVEACGAA
jgi:hypothetical protein